MSNKFAVKSPTSFSVVPTLVLAPLVLMSTCNRSGKPEAVGHRVQKVNFTPFCNVTGGVSSHWLIVPAPVVLLKFTRIKELAVPL
jgi:hypothetical protein